MAKNVVVLIDGTGNEVAIDATNVLRLAQILVDDPQRQIFAYDPGVGTQGAPSTDLMARRELVKILGLGVGIGIYDKIATAYGTLMDRYEPGDRIYLFGFSRGAYIARALAGMIGKIGILARGRENLVPFAIALYAAPENLPLAATFSKTFCDRRAEVHFLGLWDTVKSVFRLGPGSIRPTTVVLPRTFGNSAVRTVRHALAIDERRRFFRTNVWARGPQAGETDVRQVWFAGVHCDVGGGYRDACGGLSKISLEWMVREAVRHDLLIDEARRAEIMGETGLPGVSRPDPLAPMHESLGGWWRPLEFLPKIARSGPDRIRRKAVFLPKGERRFIAEGSLIHASVRTRMESDASYAPPNLPREPNWET